LSHASVSGIDQQAADIRTWRRRVRNWAYYQRSERGGVEMKDVTFGNSMSTLGKVVGYSTEILPSRIISPDTPEGFSAILDYDAKHGGETPNRRCS
jgi:hypothetical protein